MNCLKIKRENFKGTTKAPIIHCEIKTKLKEEERSNGS